MTKQINIRFSLGDISDLTTPSSTQKYKLGTVIEIADDDTKSVKKYIYVKSHGALTAYQPYVVLNSATAGSEVITGAPVALASAQALVGVPQVSFTSGYYGFIQIEGKTTIAVDAAATAGNEASLFAAHTSLTTTTGSADVNTCGYVITTTTGSANTDVLLNGYRIEIAST